jgi:leader peptidase (prepilin peptidase) / N-methyltransferase
MVRKAMKIILFLYGLIFGSFFNVVGLRVPMKQSIVRPRSACPHCQHVLTPMELIPVLSYVIQGGKCRFCRERISPLYPFIEMLTGCLFVFAYLYHGISFQLLISLSIISLLIIITVSDIRYMMIPDRILLFFLGLFLLERILIPLHPWWDSLFGAVVGFGLLLFISIVSKGGMGGGDIKLFGVLGLLLGTKLILLTFFLATLVGTVGGVIGLAVGKVKKKQPMPFGPFIGIGALISYFYGQDILQWYFSFY